MLIIGNITIEHIPHIDDTHYGSYAHEIRYAHMVNSQMLIWTKKQLEYAARDHSYPLPF
jgi:hypothetical protein